MLGSGLKASKSKLIKTKVVYLKRARSLVLSNSWPQDAEDMILGLGGLVGIWEAQALSLGAAFPLLHPYCKVLQLAMFLRESEVWIFMYNLLILMLETFFFPVKKRERNLHSDVLESAFSLCSFLFLA